MNAHSQLRLALSMHLGIAPEAIDENQHLERDWGLDPLDVILVVLQLEELAEVDLPVADLEHVETVGDLEATVRSWSSGRFRRAG
jgi:acyl carrier protein